MSNEEGIFNTVGDPKNPRLQSVKDIDADSITSTEPAQSDGYDVFANKDDLEAAQRAAERLLEIGRMVTPTRVIFASIIILVLFCSIFATWYWVIPRDAMEIEVAYFQGGGGHVILAEVDNVGSREVYDLRVEIRFESLQGDLYEKTVWQLGQLPAHSSVAGDGLELEIQGPTVWDEYRIVILLDYEDYNGGVHHESFLHVVGSWTSERFVDKGDSRVMMF